jgi:hypothetical protein
MQREISSRKGWQEEGRYSGVWDPKLTQCTHTRCCFADTTWGWGNLHLPFPAAVGLLQLEMPGTGVNALSPGATC